jgi:diketogulonate reductase-like aldo/keto reductase
MQTVRSHDLEIPALGFGTFELEDDVAEARVADALELGCRHIDTARAYRNETGVGRGLAKSGVPRHDVFLTTKLWMDEFTPEDVGRAIRDSLQRLAVDHADLVLMHWPNPEVPVIETLGALEQAREAGLIRGYGVSNFPVAPFEEARRLSPSPLVTNQVEFHPFIDQAPVRRVMRDAGVPVTAYCPLAQGRVADEPILRRIAADHDATPAQVALAWLLAEEDVIAIPRSSRRERVEENLGAAGISLSAAERDEIASLRARHERLIDPSFAPAWDRPEAA